MSYLKRFESELRPLIIHTLLRLKRLDVRNSIILVSEPRSGSTWLMEVLARHPRTIVNWEPLHPKRGVFPADYELGVRPDMYSIASNSELRQVVKEILSFRRFNDWTISHVEWAEVLFAHSVLTKMVRGVRILPWFAEEFKLVHKPIHLLRHPIPTVVSQTHHFKEVNAIETLKKMKNNTLNESLSDFLQKLQGQFEHRLALWCVFNREILNLCSDKWVTVYYEKLIRDPVGEIRKINAECDLSIPVDTISFSKPSSSDFNKMYAHDVEKQLSKWTTYLSDAEKLGLQRILDYFGIKQYSVNDIYPVMN